MKMFPNGSISGLWAQEIHVLLKLINKHSGAVASLWLFTTSSWIANLLRLEYWLLHCRLRQPLFIHRGVIYLQYLWSFVGSKPFSLCLCVYSQFSGAKRLPILCFLFGPRKLHCFLLPRYFLEKLGGRKWNCQLANLRIIWLERCLWICNEKLMRGCGFLWSYLSRMAPRPVV